MVVNLDLFPLVFLFFLCSVVEILIARTMEDYRLIQIEEELEDEEEENYNDGEYEEDIIPEGITSPRDSNLIINAAEEEEEEEDYDDDDDVDDDDDEDDDDEEDYEEREEGDELIPMEALSLSASSDDENYDDEDEDDEYYYEEEEVDELIQMISPRVSSSISHGRTLQGEVVINDGLLDDSESCEGNQENGGGNGGKEELNRGEIDGLFCPICFEAWTSGGDHQICCLPCGHIYGSSCIKKWLQLRRSSGKCPQCNNLCTLKDVRVLYATRLCVADEELQKRVRSLEAKCSYLEQKDKYKEKDGWRGEFEAHLEELKEHRKDFEAHRQEFAAFRQEFEAHRQEFEALRQEFEARQQEFVAH